MGDGRRGAVHLGTAGRDPSGPDQALGTVFARALDCGGDADAALEFAVELGRSAPVPGAGSTLSLWEQFATIGSADPTVARIVEPHLDALAVFQELGEPVSVESDTWGVFAAEGPGMRLAASPYENKNDEDENDEDENGWRLDGRKPWCSLADRLSHALVTAHTPDGRRLFAVALRQGGVRVTSVEWHARGLRAVPSGPVDFVNALATPVGAPGWYLERPGFAWGGIGVAAIWFGCAVGIARAIRDSAEAREPDQIALMHLGASDAALWAARSTLVSAARAVDAGVPTREAAGLLANRARTVVADACERVLRAAAHALGPAPLALDDRHAGRVADLQLYLRQHHAERDEAAIGRAILAGGGAAW